MPPAFGQVTAACSVAACRVTCRAPCAAVVPPAAGTGCSRTSPAFVGGLEGGLSPVSGPVCPACAALHHTPARTHASPHTQPPACPPLPCTGLHPPQRFRDAADAGTGCAGRALPVEGEHNSLWRAGAATGLCLLVPNLLFACHPSFAGLPIRRVSAERLSWQQGVLAGSSFAGSSAGHLARDCTGGATGCMHLLGLHSSSTPWFS